MRSRFTVFPVIGTCLLVWACTSAPPTPSTEQYFNDAKNNLNTMDYEVALKNLDRLIKSAGEQPFGQEGTVIRTVLLTAMAEGTRQMAEAYATGAKQPAVQAQRTVFVKMRADYYGVARVRLMNAMEGVMSQRAKLGDQPIRLDLPFPAFSATEHPALAQIKAGRAVPDAERYRAELESVRNAFARGMAGLAGAREDVPKGHARFQQGNMQVDPRLYLVEMTEDFLHLSDIFGPRGLDDSRYRRTTLEVVRDNLDLASKLLAAKPDKELETRVKTLKGECDKQFKALGI